MDVLAYDYDNGNKLLKVADTGNDLYGFKDDAVNITDTGNDYRYDQNGNMTSDANKGISSIEYNHLNLPTKVTVTGTNAGIIDYIYGADGTRLKKTVSTTGTETLYANGYVYEGNTLQFFPHAEGYVTPNTSGGFDYVYQFEDHVDNIRLSYTDANGDGDITTNEIIKESNFYPFGLSHKGYNNNVNSLGNSVAKRFMFGSKELDESLGLGTYDFGARNYDPAIGGWMNIDPLAEQMRRHSPYNYAFNNPIFFLDPDGMMPCPTGDCDSFFTGMVETARQFNQNLADRAERFIDNPVKSINKGLADTGGFLADVTNISGIMGEENQLYNQIGETANKIANFSDLSNKEKGALFMGGVVVAAEVTISKKPSAKRLGRGNSSQSPLLLTDGGSVPNAGGKITSFTTNETSTFFRVSDNGGQGGFLTKTKPSSSAFAQEALALPPGNTASLIQKVTVPAGIQLQRSRALPAFGKRGGAEQFQILNYDQRSLIDFGTAKPFKLDSSF